MYAAKAIAAVIGAGITAALGIIPENTTTWVILTVASAVCTAVVVYFVPNTSS